VGRDAKLLGQVNFFARFNPRARVGRDPWYPNVYPYTTWFQSTRPRGARLDDNLFIDYDSLVSIHAPAWGATPSLMIFSIL